MDPVSAIGVASSIVTFVELAYSFLSTVYTVYDNERQVEHVTLETVSTKMKELSSQLISEKQFSQSQEDVAIVSLATQCHQLAADMTRRLSKSKGVKGKITHSIKAAIKIICSKNDIARLQKTLDGCRAQLHLHLSVSNK
jgi:glycine/serine hydroxymethyltransferase